MADQEDADENHQLPPAASSFPATQTGVSDDGNNGVIEITRHGESSSAGAETAPDFDEEGRKILAAAAKEREAAAAKSKDDDDLEDELKIVARYQNLNLLYKDPNTGGRVFCGNIVASKDRRILDKYKIRNIGNCQTKTSRNTFEAVPGFSYKRFQIQKWMGILKRRQMSALQFATPTFDFIDGAIARGEGVLIHCLAGAHRAGTTSVAFLMHKLNIFDAAKATALAKTLRHAIDPLFNLARFLKLLEVDLLAQKQRQQKQQMEHDCDNNVTPATEVQVRQMPGCTSTTTGGQDMPNGAVKGAEDD